MLFDPSQKTQPASFCRAISDYLSRTIWAISPSTTAWLFACRRQTLQGHLAIFTFAILAF
jgi:hypothetical protein